MIKNVKITTAKKIAAMLCVVAMMLMPILAVKDVQGTQVTDASYPLSFTDVKANDWFYPYLKYLVENRLINGKTETTFEPNSTFSYAECSAIIVRYLGLEDEAEKRKNEIISRCPELKNQWFAGYFEVLENLGIFKDYGVYQSENGKIIAVDKIAANSPITRYRFAESISRSFELESSLKAQNVYTEMGGSGREFIVGGVYDKEILGQYASLIKDYNDIPDSAKEYVLKAYYNGIFVGDTTGNFYPHNNLTRAEMAKVLATVSDYSLRSRLIEDKYARPVTENMLHTDAFGVKTLSYSSALDILTNAANNIVFDGVMATYTAKAVAPMGYAVDAYLYQKSSDNVYKLVAQSTLHSFGNGTFSFYANDIRVLFVLRNVAENSKTEGTLNVTVSGGKISECYPMIRQM